MATTNAADAHDAADLPDGDAHAKPHCGIIMPMGDTDGYVPGHWGQVQRLITRAAAKAGFTASIVGANSADDMIQASIVRGIYQDPVVVCDVSSLNANVMLELGLRMATLLPLVLVFDGEKDYPFDIRSILNVRYPKGLNIFRMEAFVEELADKIQQVDEAQTNKSYQPFLSHFKEVKIEPAQLNSTTQSVNEVLQTVMDGMASIQNQLNAIERQNGTAGGSADSFISDPLGELTKDEEKFLLYYLSQQEIFERPNSIMNAADKAVDFTIKQLYPFYGAAATYAKKEHLKPRAMSIASGWARPSSKNR